MNASRQTVWSQDNLANPHAVADKAQRVRRMFAAIAPSYDLNNRLHSLGRDQAWRRAAVRMAEVKPTDVVLDVACGTGDLSLAFADAGAARVIGVDFTFEMLPIARAKSQGPRAKSEGPRAKGQGPSNLPSTLGPRPSALHPRPSTLGPAYHAGDAMRLPLADASVDVVSIAFGIRNVADPAAALREFHRVLRPGGRLVILEFGLPTSALLRRLYLFYFRHILPRTAALIARDRTGAYKYLPQSVSTFIDRAAMLDIMGRSGFAESIAKPLTFGVALVYRGVKRQDGAHPCCS